MSLWFIVTITNFIAYGTQRFNAAFPSALQQSRSTQFLVLIPISLRSILIMSSNLCLGLPNGFFPVGVPVKILKAFLPSYILATWPAHLKLLDLTTLAILGERHKLLSYSYWRLLHSTFSSLLGPNIRLRILFSNTLSLNSSLNVRDHASQPYSTTGNIIVLYILTWLCVHIHLFSSDWEGSPWVSKPGLKRIRQQIDE